MTFWVLTSSCWRRDGKEVQEEEEEDVEEVEKVEEEGKGAEPPRGGRSISELFFLLRPTDRRGEGGGGVEVPLLLLLDGCCTSCSSPWLPAGAL